MVLFSFYSNSNRTFYEQIEEILIRRCVLCLGLRCLPMSHNKDARFICVNWIIFFIITYIVYYFINVLLVSKRDTVDSAVFNSLFVAAPTVFRALLLGVLWHGS